MSRRISRYAVVMGRIRMMMLVALESVKCRGCVSIVRCVVEE